MENGGQNSNNNNNGNYSWGYREVGGRSSSFDWVVGNNNNNNHSLMFDTHHQHYHQQQEQEQEQQQQQSLYYGGGGGGGEGRSHVHLDPHLTCLKLGKRHYFEDSTTGNGSSGVGGGIGDVLGLRERHVSGFPLLGGGGGGFKRGKSYDGGPPAASSSSSSLMGVVPRCQVEGCHVVLLNAKDYHRRHKVCEMHSKAPKVVVLGTEQRFCQQCSRFHVILEFDDAKRSCRRRLAGHNERRRKSSNDSLSSGNLSQEHHGSVNGRFPCMSSSTGRALSLLSSDLSSRSSAALCELISENRAAILARQLLLEQGWHHHHAMDDLMSNDGINQPAHGTQQHHQVFPEQSEWARFHEAGGHVTLDLMHDPSSPFGYLTQRTKSKEEEEECSEIWKSLEGTHVVSSIHFM